jgi:DNA modification methylase
MRKEVIGDATLYLGDCMEVMPTLGEVDAIVTDPHFGMNFVSSHRKEDTKHRPIENDDKTDLLEWTCELDVKHSKYIFCRWDNLYNVPKPRSLVTWVKNNHSMGDLKHEHGRKTEVCLFYPAEGHFFPDGRPNDVVSGVRTGNEYHPTQKPVELMKKIVAWTSGVVADPFMGSGTTGVACLQMGRKFIGIEKDPEYFEIACERIKRENDQLKLF